VPGSSSPSGWSRCGSSRRTRPPTAACPITWPTRAPPLFTFLRAPAVDATNNWAEVWMRPIVVNRQTWGGNRTDTGVLVQETLASVLTTFHVQNKDPFSPLVTLQRSPTPFVLDEIIPDRPDSS
jgi:Transposase IS66 family